MFRHELTGSFPGSCDDCLTRLLRVIKLVLPDHFQEAVEQVAAIVRPWGCLWMVLHGEGWEAFMLESLHRFIVIVDMCNFQLCSLYGLLVYRVTVVLGGDEAASALQFLNRMV